MLETPGSIGKTFELVSGDTPIEEAVAACERGARAEVLRRVRSVPEGRVTTYGDLCPGAPRFAGRVLSECHDPDVPWQRIVRADGSLAKGERQRRLLEPRACPSAASAWTCARPGCRSG